MYVGLEILQIRSGQDSVKIRYINNVLNNSQLVATLSTMMNQSIFYRLFKPIVSSSSSFGDAFHGPFIGVMKQYHSISPQDIQEETEPFSLINPYLSTDSVARWMNTTPSREILGSGMILLKNYINLVGQVEIVNICQKWGVGSGGFYQPRNQSGAKLRLHMTCFGRYWDPVTRYEKGCRSDGSEPPPLPYELISFTKGIFKYGNLRSDEFPSMNPDVCLVNFYSSSGRLGLHQDCDESSDSLTKGLPVVSISIGDSAEFYYGHTRDENKLDKVLLESGDVLIFGGKSRLIFHGVKRILPMSCPRALLLAARLTSGRLNLTLKQF